jgi:hypothetical protein
MAAAGGGITKILNPGLYRCPARRSRDLETILSYDSRFRKVVAMFASGIVSEIVPSLPCKPTGRGVLLGNSLAAGRCRRYSHSGYARAHLDESFG